MELKRTILAVALSMAVLVLFQYFAAPPPEQRPAPTASAAPPAAPVPLTPPAPAASLQAPSGDAPALSRARIENDLLAVDLSSRGAVVVGASLKEYREGTSAASSPVALLRGPSGQDLAGATRLVQALPDWAQGYEEVERGKDRVAYRLQTPGGLSIEKVYSLSPGRYDVSLEVRVRNAGAEALRDRLGVVLVQDFGTVEDRYSFTGPAYYKDGAFEEVKVKNVKEGVQEGSGVSWAALLEKYFLVAAVPPAAEGTSLRLGAHLGQEKVVEAELAGPAFDLPSGGEHAETYRLYLGPKLSEALAPLGSNLDDVVHYGFFHVIAKPLMVFLKAIYGFTGNYGIAIIVLTTLVKGAFWPLSARSYRSMQRMKELQPKLQKIKERYGKDRERLNMEMMQLYKTHKVNPLGGCLPMLIQIPVFFALYKILLETIELRHAPFFWWIQDLSAKDPYYITPLLMGASMFLQQMMTPMAGGSEAQAKMMKYGMPAIFTFMFLNFPSGLVVYWLVNNILSIAQQGLQMKASARTA